ncbi:Carbohydrate esterase family 4 protein [Paramicrosporidium saccamoebae]|uniref:Carbohydrate esterase family 4 protein n=1 Tax=Paramicrosporidium saccamoebae TaxID=1246581 RepID=A0A2H9TMT2_9FUNG|nr:Carbohydrate esterase family 4 protein [Paramicrosporidium saccamoebae]
MHANALFLLLSTAALQMADAKLVNQCTQRGMYAMTWDDGPAQYTPQLLDTLASKNVKVTFHITTKYLTDPNIQAMIQRISGAGHLIGLRTESDWNLFNMSDEQIRAGVARQANVLASFTGYVPKFVRLPYNGYDDRVLAAIESTGLIATTHNLETYDYNNDGERTRSAVKLALSLQGKGAGSFISVQHDGVQQSVGVAGQIIDQIKSSGYKLVKLDECLGLGDMSKNKEPLKGADDSIDLGPLSGGAVAVPGAAGAPADPNAGDAAVAGQGSSNSNGVNVYGPSAFAAMVAILMALGLQI